jgi:hypothetical protein
MVLLVSPACMQMESTQSAPSPLPPTVSAPLTLTVRVFERSTSESPIVGALVVHESTDSYTDGAGESRIVVQSGRETTVRVSAPGYQSMEASAVLNSHERWTFFLEPKHVVTGGNP